MVILKNASTSHSAVTTAPSTKEVALRVASCNLQVDLDLEKFDPTLHIMIEFLKSHPIHKPLTKSIKFPLSIIHKAYLTAVYEYDEDYIEFDVNDDNTTKLYKVEFLKAIGLPESNEKKTFYEPTNEELFDVLDQMGHLPPRLKYIRGFKRSKLPAMWQFLVHIILRCLCGRVRGTDMLNRAFLVLLFGLYTGKEVDFGTILWKDFASHVFPKKTEIPCARFWALVLQRAYTELKVPLPKDEEMFTPRAISRYIISDQSEFGKVACLPEAMLQYIDENSEVLIKHKEEMFPGESGHPPKFSQPNRPAEGNILSPTRKKQIALHVKKFSGRGIKRKFETIPAPQAKKRPTESIDSSSQEDDVSPKEDVGVENSPEQPQGTHSQINHEPIGTSSPSFHNIRSESSDSESILQGDLGDSSIGTQGRSRGQTRDDLVRQLRDEYERQIREQSEREEKERVEKERLLQIDLNEPMLKEERLRDENAQEELRKAKAAKHAENRKNRKEIIHKKVLKDLIENKGKKDELNSKKQREEKEREADAKKEEERRELVRMLREEQQKMEDEEWARTAARLLERAMSFGPSPNAVEESAEEMEEDFVFAPDDGFIQDSDSLSIIESVKPSKSIVFLGSSETESKHDEEVPNGETKTLPTTTVGTSTPRRRPKWKKKSKYISRVEFNSLNRKLSEVLEVVKKIPPSEEKFVSKEEFGEMQKIVTSLAQRVPSLETRERTLRESIVSSTTDALRDMEHKRTADTFKYLDRMDEMVKMVKGIQQSFDDLTNTMGRQHADEIVRISEQLCDYRNKNIILQAVLVKVMQSAHQLVRPHNGRFDEVLLSIQKVQNSLDALPKTLSDDELSKQIHFSFLKVFEMIDDLKGSRVVDVPGFSSTKCGVDENVVITKTSKETPPPSPKIDEVSKPQPPPNITIPPTEEEIHESPPQSPKILTPPTSFMMPPGKMTPEFPEVAKAPIKTHSFHENSTKEEQHALTPWVYDISQLKEDELVPKQTTAPPTSNEYQWDIPMSPHARYYPVFQPLHPNLSREMQMPIELARLDEFFKAHAQLLNGVWSLRRIIKVLGYKKRSFQNNEYFAFEVVRSDNKQYYFSEADFPNLNPNDLYVIGRHFLNKLLTHEPSRFPFLQIQRFLRSLVYDFGSIDGQRFDSFMENPPEEMNQDLEGIENRHRGPTDDPEYGIIFSNEKESPKLFFRLKQKHLYTTKFLEQMIDLTLRSKKASTALKVKIIEEIEWWVSVRKWIKSVTDLVTKKI